MAESVLKIGEMDNLKTGLSERKSDPSGDAETSIKDDMFAVPENIRQQVNKRIEELRKLQLEYFIQEVNHYNECHNLELKYVNMSGPIFKMRQEIINGSSEMLKENSSDGEKRKNGGIPGFWLNVLLNSGIKKMIEDEDKDVLMHLKDISMKYDASNYGNFILEFHFNSNQYFNNPVLTKEYEVKCCLNPTDPYYFEGPEFVKCTGSIIDWNEGKNVTVKTIMKENETNQTDMIEVQKQSFFNFFSTSGQLDQCNDDDVRDFLIYDFEIGKYIKDRIIPRAILYYVREDADMEPNLSSLESEESFDIYE